MLEPLGRAIDNASIRLKLLISPAFAIMALVLVCGAAWQGFSAESAANARVADLTLHRLKPATDARLLAASLQTEMFRFISFGMMGSPHAKLEVMADGITQRNIALDDAIATLAAGTDDEEDRSNLQQILDFYHKQSSHATDNFLNNLGWGATTARNAALALDSVIAAAAAQERDGEVRVVEAKQWASALNDRLKLRMLVMLLIGSSAMVVVSLVVAQRIAGPIRHLTIAMSRLAGKHYSHDIPALAQRDEVGSMARAVEVFRQAMMRGDALTSQQRATQAFLDSVLEHVPAPILVESALDFTYVHVNQAAEILLGVSRSELLGRSLVQAMPGPSATSILARHAIALESGQKLVDEGVTIETFGGGQRLATVTRLAIAGTNGRPEYLLIMMEDITERRSAEKRIAHMAHYDALTDLPNRALFADLLADALQKAQASGTRVGVLGLDLDFFKEVNDTQGHAAGDALLRDVAARLRSCVRETDTVARLGGDEFAVIQTGLLSVKNAKLLADRLIRKIKQPFDIDGQQTFVGLSVGIALSAPAVSSSDLLKQADMALYAAKQSGRGTFRCFVPEMDERLQDQRALENDLRVALDAGQLSLQYQPQVDLGTRAIIGAEALMRWNRPGHGNVPPNIFIPLAEDSGLISPLGDWLIERACHEAMRWPRSMHVAVNVSPVQLRLPGFVETVRRALMASGLEPRRLELEVTEGILLRDTKETLAVFMALRTLGVRIALDDFGTGYASLSYLRKFSFDKIKIDRSFVKSLATDPAAGAIVRAVVELSKALGVSTIAEGVESDDEIEALRRHGCNAAQGFRFWRPMTDQALFALVNPAQTATPSAVDGHPLLSPVMGATLAMG
jgi:diguanylate cyclase (GGDEF)-like protein/PAS domain S-box-containing protein